MNLKSYIRDIPNFPKEGVLFKDITPLLKSEKAFNFCINEMSKPYVKQEIDYVVSIESRGFIFGTPLAMRLKAGFVPIRKPGKLPSSTYNQSYALEYGTDAVEIHTDALEPGSRVLIIDDVLATGGTMSAATQLVEKSGATISGLSFLISLSFLQGEEKLSGYAINSLISY